MAITKEFLESEIASIEAESVKAQHFLLQSQAVLNAYKMLLTKLEQPATEETTDGNAD